jgi:hypothetical protein
MLRIILIRKGTKKGMGKKIMIYLDKKPCIVINGDFRDN